MSDAVDMQALREAGQRPGRRATFAVVAAIVMMVSEELVEALERRPRRASPRRRPAAAATPQSRPRGVSSVEWRSPGSTSSPPCSSAPASAPPPSDSTSSSSRATPPSCPSPTASSTSSPLSSARCSPRTSAGGGDGRRLPSRRTHRHGQLGPRRPGQPALRHRRRARSATARVHAAGALGAEDHVRALGDGVTELHFSASPHDSHSIDRPLPGDLPQLLDPDQARLRPGGYGNGEAAWRRIPPRAARQVQRGGNPGLRA